jgi:hypothetical protein
MVAGIPFRALERTPIGIPATVARNIVTACDAAAELSEITAGCLILSTPDRSWIGCRRDEKARYDFPDEHFHSGPLHNLLRRRTLPLDACRKACTHLLDKNEREEEGTREGA